MQDRDIVNLYWQRNEDAIRETEEKYGNYLLTIADHILNNEEDSRECVNDTYFKAWCSMPENRPENLAHYLSRIVRERAIDVYRLRKRQKRKGAEYTLSLSELDECTVEGPASVEETVDQHLLAEALNRFLKTLPEDQLAAFLGRYYYADPVKEIAQYLQCSESKVKSILFRIRKKLKSYLEEEGFLYEI